jgi:hypothetical protein
MKRSTAHAEGLSPVPAVSHSVVRTWFLSLARLRALFRRPARQASFQRQPVAPAVILACENCGFDYSVTRLELAAGETAIVWTCDCGSRFIPPGGAPTSQMIRP